MTRRNHIASPPQDEFVPCFFDECPRFLTRHLFRLPSDDLEFIFSHAAAVRPPSSELYILVPVYYRETSIAQFIEMITSHLASCSCTVLVFLNATEGFDYDPQAYSMAVCDARRLIDEALANLRSSHIYLLDKTFERETTMGRIRSLVCDVALVNAHNHNLRHPVILCNDIDVSFWPDNYLQNVYEQFRDLNLKMCAGPVNYGYSGTTPVGLPSGLHVPELYVFNELNCAIQSCARSGEINFEKRVWAEGANMAFTAAAYCACGGFNPAKSSGEDDDLSRALHRYNPNSFRRPNIDEMTIFKEDGRLYTAFRADLGVVTDPRRVLRAIRQGLPGIEAWADTPFMKSPGAHLSTPDLARECETCDLLITSTRLREALSPSAQSSTRRAVLERLEWLVERSLHYDGKARNREQLGRVLKEVGFWEGSWCQHDDGMRWRDYPLIMRLEDLLRESADG